MDNQNINNQVRQIKWIQMQHKSSTEYSIITTTTVIKNKFNHSYENDTLWRYCYTVENIPPHIKW